MTPVLQWSPAAVLALGVLLNLTVGGQRELPLRKPLSEVLPSQVGELRGRDVPVSQEEQRVAGMTSYAMRVYESPGGATGGLGALSVYVGYYQSQTQGKTIHSPKNCLPGAGWEALGSGTLAVSVPGGRVQVNRYLLQRGGERALVLYWYQGRGRVEANEYRVKWHLLRDAALRRRSDEALVRIIVPISDNDQTAQEFAVRVANTLVPAVYHALPT